jgi:hypothetical protein
MLLELVRRVVGDLLHCCRNGNLMRISRFLFFQNILGPSTLNREQGEFRDTLCRLGLTGNFFAWTLVLK